MKKIKILSIFLIGLIASGWVFSGVQYLKFKREKENLKKEMEKLQSEVSSYTLLIDQIDKSYKEIEGVLKILSDLKEKIENIKMKYEKGE